LQQQELAVSPSSTEPAVAKHFAVASLHIVLLVGMFISYLEIYNNDGPDPNHTLVVEAFLTAGPTGRQVMIC
jgi:hypothetical protein